MRYLTILILFLPVNLLLFSVKNSFSQVMTINISDSIKWTSPKKYYTFDDQTEQVLNFNGGHNRSKDLLPVFFSRQEVNGRVIIESVKITEAVYEYFSPQELQGILHLDNLQSTHEVNAYSRTFRNKESIAFELVPLRSSQNSSMVEKLVYFEAEIKYRHDHRPKSQRTYTSTSVLSSGKWHKIRVADDGIYKITYEQLIDMGFSNLNNIGVFGYGGKLPKKIADNVYDDLPERPILRVDANNDGVFNEGDYILFYADGPHKRVFNVNSDAYHTFHPYSDYAYYFVSDQGTNKEAIFESSPTNFDLEVTKYDDYRFLQKDSINLIRSGRQWFWRAFDFYTTHSFSHSFPNTSTTDPAIVHVHLAARASSPSSFNLTINGQAQDIIPIQQVGTTSTGIYARMNSLNRFEVTPNSSTFNYTITYNKSTSDARGWLDYIALQFKRHLVLDGNFLNFRDLESVSNGQTARFNIENAGSSTIVWDISERTSYKLIETELNGSTLSFNADVSDLREFIAFNYDGNFPSPTYKNASDVGPVENQNLHAISPKDLIIVTHPNFYSQAQQIKQIHKNYDNYSGVVVTAEKIYNEFSSGTPDASAIRNFVKMLYDRASSQDELPRNLLLVGDGSYDNKSRSSSVSNFILTYQSEASLAPTSSFVSDDFYVFLDDGEGGFGPSDVMDMGVGRLPVKSTNEAQTMVNKLEHYYSSQSFGSWKNVLTFVADDFDGGELVHQNDTEKLTNKIDTLHPVFNIDKIYLDDYQQVSTIQGQRYPEVNQAINNRINRGTLLMNWVGHGNAQSWAHERVLTVSMIQNWRNDKYPIIITATCEFSPFDNHDIVSAGELALLNPEGGGIGLYTSTRLAFASSNYRMLDKFFDHFFERDNNNRVYSIGEIIAFAKNDLPGDTNKRVFTYLGSPAMRPGIPDYLIKTTKINGIPVDDFSDTISSQELVSFEGVVTDHNGSILEDFNGFVSPTVYDKRMTYTTQANDGYGPLDYTAQRNIIFNGNASVTNGEFRFEFVVPIDITYFYDAGKVSYYAHNNFDREAHGYDKSFIIGGSSDNPVTSDRAPEIELFMNSEDFIQGGITDESPLLIANLFSEVGINTVGSGIGHDITLTINDNTNEMIVLNDFYEAKLDDFTQGSINYKISDLDIGPHTLTLKAWDVLNKSAEASTDFIVASSSELVIDQIFNYPNPFSTSTEFYFNHNQPNAQLDVLIEIYTVAGNHVKTIDAVVMSDGYRSQPIAWNARDKFGDTLAKGVYIYKLRVREPGGNTVEKFEKLVILN